MDAAAVTSMVNAVPQAEPFSIVIIESTGQGPHGEFYGRCMAADKGTSDYACVFLPWFADSTYRLNAPDDFEPAAYKGKKCRLASRIVEHEELGRVKLVFVEEFNKKDQPTRCYGLMCTDPHYPDELVYRAHKLRWKIEEGYREMRQHHGFGAFHSRHWNAIYGHLTFAFLSLLLTTAIRRFNERIATQTLGWVKEHYLNAVVELQEVADTLIVRFSQGFLQQFGLFQLVPEIGYVDW